MELGDPTDGVASPQPVRRRSAHEEEAAPLGVAAMPVSHLAR